MQKFVTKYAVAAHLAILAVAPLFLSAFLPAERLWVAILWLSLVVAVWVLANPSLRKGETLSTARVRMWSRVVREPLFWILLLVVLGTGLRALNVGASLQWDVKSGCWSLGKPSWAWLPGCARGVGSLSFAVSVALVVVFMGARYSLGKSGRGVFYFTATLLSAFAALLLVLPMQVVLPRVELVACLRGDASYVGLCFGILSLASLVTATTLMELGWSKMLVLAFLAMTGNFVGTFIFSTPLMSVIFFGAFLWLWVLALIYASKELPHAAAMRLLIGVVVAMVLAVTIIGTGLMGSLPAAKVRAFATFEFFPEGYWPMHETLSRIAQPAWEGAMWLGTGLGSFEGVMRQNATSQDWLTILSGQCSSVNGGWQLLVERGLVGVLMLVIPLVMMVGGFLWRLVQARFDLTCHPMIWIVLLAFLPVLASGYFECSFLRPDVMLLLAALFACGISSLPGRRK